MDVVSVVGAFARYRCRFVVIGSAARALLGEAVRPQDLDIVVDGDAANRVALVSALRQLDALVRWRGSWVPVGDLPVLPWDWGWRSRTAFGEIDLMTRLIDGTTFASHDSLATTAALVDGIAVRCHGTRWAA